MRGRPTLYLVSGLPGAGKTTKAHQIESEHRAVRLSPDDWMAALAVDLFDEEFRGRLECALWTLAQRLLDLGVPVILDFGFWVRSERERLRDAARERGCRVELIFFDIELSELWRRLESRNAHPVFGTVAIPREEFYRYVALFESPTAEELATYDRATRVTY